ncbi:thioredoxin family protein [Lacticigenium naphthae]|uniref:thioredoxin family protein n=1 Tax=Lacticigenium naphthae TaxID=515351 RepID=UPI0003FE2CC3|nr:thioredoxin family protein [Lacticigenium naphthae]
MEGFKEARSIDELKEFTAQNDLAFIFFYGTNCSVCHAVLPQIKPILEKYPQIKTMQANIEEMPEISGEYTIFTIPVLLLFAENREVMRFARFVEMDKLDRQLDKITEAFAV